MLCVPDYDLSTLIAILQQDSPLNLYWMMLNTTVRKDNTYQMSGNQISVKTLDLNQEFSEIAKQLNAIVSTHFGTEGNT